MDACTAYIFRTSPFYPLNLSRSPHYPSTTILEIEHPTLKTGQITPLDCVEAVFHDGPHLSASHLSHFLSPTPPPPAIPTLPCWRRPTAAELARDSHGRAPAHNDRGGAWLHAPAAAPSLPHSLLGGGPPSLPMPARHPPPPSLLPPRSRAGGGPRGAVPRPCSPGAGPWLQRSSPPPRVLDEAGEADEQARPAAASGREIGPCGPLEAADGL